MTTDKLIEMHESCISTLETIKHAEASIEVKRQVISQMNGLHPTLRRKHLHGIEILKAAIERLHARHRKQVRKVARFYNVGATSRFVELPERRENIGI